MAVFSFVQNEVWLSDSFAPPADAAWVQYPFVDAMQLTRGLSPTMDQGVVMNTFGLARRESNSLVDPTLDYNLPLASNRYVRIKVPDHSIDWWGYLQANQQSVGPEVTADIGAGDQQVISYGTQTLSVVGLEYFLARELCRFDWVKGSPDFRVDRAIGFNTGSGVGRGNEYEKKGNKDPGSLVFSSNPTTAVEWTAAEAVKYLLDKHGPANSGGTKRPLAFELDPLSEAYLSWYKPSVETEGRSVWQVLNEIICPERGLAWWLVVQASPFKILLRVTSMTTGPITLPGGGGTLPATLFASPLPDLQGIDKEPKITRDAGRQWDRVFCRGARRRACFTVSFASGNLAIGWPSAEETAYRTALGTDPKANDQFRRGHRFARVYNVFQIPPTWDGLSNDGSGTPSAGSYAAGRYAAGGTSIVAAEPISMPCLRLLRSLPIKVGYDYDNVAAPVARDPADVNPEWQKPFVIVDAGSGKWRFTHDIGDVGDGEERPTNYRLHVLDGTAGLEITAGGGMPHSLAKNHFVPGTDGATDHNPEVDYEDFRATVAAEWDAYCEGRYPASDPAAGEFPMSTLFISIGDRARLDTIAPGTVYDVQSGAIKKTLSGSILRDDRELCEDVARIAFEWYGVARAEVELVCKGEDLPVDVGVMITTIGTAEVQETVNALVSSVSHDFKSGVATITAGFTELDFSRLA